MPKTLVFSKGLRPKLEVKIRGYSPLFMTVTETPEAICHEVLGQPHPRLLQVGFCGVLPYEQFDMTRDLRVHFCQVPKSPIVLASFCIFCFNVKK